MKRKIILCALILSILSSVLSFLQVKNSVIYTEKAKLVEAISYVHNRIVYMNDKVKKGEISKENAQRIIIEEMPLYNTKESKNFVWINDYNNNNVIYNPMLKEGSNCAKIKDNRGIFYYDKLTQMAKNGEHKFLFYNDTRLTENNTPEKINKLSTVVAFPEWEWVIGSGVYFDEVNNIVSKTLLMIICFNATLFLLATLVMNWLYVVGMEKILDSLPYPAWYKDKNNNFLIVNDAYLDYMDLKAVDVINKNEKDIYEKFNIEKRLLEKDESFNNKTGKYLKEEISINGQKKYVQNLTLKLLNVKNSIQGYIGCYVDITHKQKIDEIKSEFISIASHELRTPLTSIIGGLDLTLKLYSTQLPQKAQVLLDVASKNAGRLKLIVDNILNIDKIETDMMVYNCKNHSLKNVVDDVIEEMASYISEFNVNIRINNISSSDIIYTDKEKMNQILVNIISNAVKFSKKDSFVDINTYKDNDKMVLRVTNYDNPIPNEFKDKIFEKFTQSNSTDRKSTYGSGLGLYITKQLALKMGGDVWFTSDEKETTFFVSIVQQDASTEQ